MLTLAFEQSDISQGLTLMAVGMVVVFSALVALLLVIGAISRFGDDRPRVVADSPLQTASAANAKAKAEAAKSPEKAEEKGPAIDPHVLAVLTAAATSVVKRPVVIRQARFVRTIDAAAWSRQGRRTIMASHRPRRSK